MDENANNLHPNELLSCDVKYIPPLETEDHIDVIQEQHQEHKGDECQMKFCNYTF